MTEWTFPLWAMAQACIVLYLIGVSLPYALPSTTHKERKRLNRAMIERYEAQKQQIIRKCREQERLKLQCAIEATTERTKRVTLPKTNLRKNVRINLQTSSSSSGKSSSSSSSSSLSSDSSIEETTEEEEEELVVKNDRAMLMQYVHGMDLFDGQSSTTSASAATTIIFNNARKPNAVRRI